MAAVGELQQEYGDRIDFVLVPPAETEERKHELERYSLGSHGLVAFDAEGEPAGYLPGHEFQKPEIEALVVALLAER